MCTVANIKAAKPEKAAMVESMIVRMAQTGQLAGKVCTKYCVVCFAWHKHDSWQRKCVLSTLLCMAQTVQLAGNVCTKYCFVCCALHRQNSWQGRCVLNAVLCVVYGTDRTAGRESVY